MYCVNCGSKLSENALYCGECGFKVNNTPKVVYVSEEPLQPIMGNFAVVSLTLCILFLAILTIVLSSVITREIPNSQRLSSHIIDYYLY